MSDRLNYIGWFLLVVLITLYITVSNITILAVNKQEREGSEHVMSESVDELKLLIENNQSRLEKKILDFRKSLHIQCDQSSNNDSMHKNLAKLLLLVIKMKDSLLEEAKFNNQMSTIKSLALEISDHDIENAINEIERVKEIDTLCTLKTSFVKIVDDKNYENSSLLKKIILKWVSIRNKSDPTLKEIEDLINDNDWQGIARLSNSFGLANPEFKPWLNKLSSLVIAYSNILTIYQRLLQHIS